MKALPAFLSTGLLALLVYLAYMMDQWVGVMAFTWPYLLFCLISAAVIGGAWIPWLGKRAYLAGLVAFALLSVHMLMPPPSERILRSASLKLVPGTHEEAIQGILAEEYDGTAYSMPEITREADRVHVSLIYHEPGNCTALVLHLEDGKVVGSEYMPD